MQNTTYDIVFFETFAEEEQAIKRFLPPNIRGLFYKTTLQEIDSPLLAPVISIRTQTIIPQHYYKNLTGVISRSQGYDHLLKVAREHPDIKFGYLSEYCAYAVAEQAFLCALSLKRKLKSQMRAFKRFNRSELGADGFKKQHALIVGVGQIGKELMKMCKNFNMEVKGVDINQTENGLNYVSLLEGLSWADIVFCCLPLTAQTKSLLDYKMIAQGKKNPVVVNVSRGEVTPLKDMEKLLNDGLISGLAMDVYEHEAELSTYMRQGALEHYPIIQRLFKREDVIFTPHNAFNTFEALEKKARLTVESIIEFRDHQKFPMTVTL